MNSSRRNFLKIAGGGTIFAAGGAGWFLASRSPDKALLPWQKAGQYADLRRRALSYAILAPNPHNRQPWLVELPGEDTVVVYRDKNRDLPHTDPYSRQLTIGLGCFLELFDMAAAQSEYRVETTLFPQGEENGPVASMILKQGGAKSDPLFSHVLDRRSCKEPFEDRQLSSQHIEIIKQYARVVSEERSVRFLRDLTVNAWRTEAGTPRTLKESVDLMRFGKTEINANPDGINLGGPFLETLMLLGMLNHDSLLDPSSSASAEGEKIYHQMLTATPAYAVLTTKGNGRVEQIETGRRWLRLNLAATGQGISLHPVSQALQEYAEMESLYKKVHERLAGPGETVQMLGRLGYGPAVAPAPRWPVETRIVDGTA